MPLPETPDASWAPSLKQTLRVSQRRVLSLVSASARKANSESIVATVMGLKQWASAKSVALYYPMQNHAEVDVLPLFEIAIKQGKIVAFPVIANEAPALSIVHSIQGFADIGHRFPEPRDQALIAPSSIELFLVPSMAFDPKGARLGHGSGFYDRLLANAPGIKIGVGYQFQIVVEVPTTARDIAMDLIVTERQLFVCGDGEQNR